MQTHAQTHPQQHPPQHAPQYAPQHATRRTHVRRLLAAALLVAALPLTAHAQFGALKRLRHKAGSDSATKDSVASVAHDSVSAKSLATLPSPAGAKSAALAAVADKATGGDSTPKRSRLARVASKAVSASQKFEDATGLSVTDVALIATGAGVGAVAAKKLGADPTSVSARAASRASTQHATAQQVSLAGMSASPRSSAAAGRAPQMAWPTAAGRPMPANAPYSDADLATIQAFQEEMMRVSNAAGRGDADAQARLQRLQEISTKHQPEVERLSTRASAADTASMRRLVNVEVDIMREWLKDGRVAPKSAAKAPAKESAKAPAKAGKP